MADQNPYKSVFPVVDGAKKPDTKRLGGSWKSTSWGDNQAAAHQDKGHRIGVCPARYGATVLDVDEPTPMTDSDLTELTALISQLQEGVVPYHITRTPSGGVHMWYLGVSLRNGDWHIGRFKGQVRSGRGYVVCYDPLKDVFDARADFQSAELVADSLPGVSKHGNIIWEEVEDTGRFTDDDFQAAVAEMEQYLDYAFEEVKPDHKESLAWHWEGQTTEGIGLARLEGGLFSLRSSSLSEALGGLPLSIDAPNPTYTPNDMVAAARDKCGGDWDFATGKFRRSDEPPCTMEGGYYVGFNHQTLRHMLWTMGVGVRYDMDAGRVETDYDYGGYRALDDVHIDNMKQRIETGFKIWSTTQNPYLKPAEVSNAKYVECYNTVGADNSVSPTGQWLHSLESANADDSAETWLCELFGADDTPYVRWVAASLLVNTVRRVLEPGCQIRTFPVLMGDPGIGKSRALQWLLPDHLRRYFSDNLTFDRHNAEETAYLLSCKVLVEASEMAGSGRAHTDHMKAILTRTTDSVRRKYGRNVTDIPRHCMIVGTANTGTMPVPDEDAVRARLALVNLPHGAHVEPWMQTHRARLWASAMSMRLQADRFRMIPFDLRESLQEASGHEVFRDEHLIAKVEEALNLINYAQVDSFTMADLNLPGNISGNRIGQALKHLECEKFRTAQGSRWRKIDNTEEANDG